MEKICRKKLQTNETNLTMKNKIPSPSKSKHTGNKDK